uniref:Uncharacterized protein n=1 Tax=Rhizophora mucronata TaxID=61149 RepID=A0A2P2QNA5_RHIMU
MISCYLSCHRAIVFLTVIFPLSNFSITVI